MRVKSREGLTLVEPLIALVVLTVGILALAGSAALASRMAGRGALSTRVAFMAATRIEQLRRTAFSTVPACTSSEWRGDSAGVAGLRESWELLDAGGPVTRVRVVLQSRHPTGTASDTFVAGFLCGRP